MAPCASEKQHIANMQEFFALCSRARAFTATETDAVFWTMTGVSSFPLFNSVVRANFDSTVAGESVDAVINEARRRDVPVLWWVAPSTSPPDLSTTLLEAGFQNAGTTPAMEIGPHDGEPPMPRDEFLVERIGRSAPGKSAPGKSSSLESSVRDWAQVSASGFDLEADATAAWIEAAEAFGSADQALLLLGTWRGKPVATAMIVFAGGVAGIYAVATLPDARGRGFGSAITAQAAGVARNEGFPIVVLQSSSMGHSVYRRLGFRDVFDYRMLLFTPRKGSEQGGR